MEPLPQKPEPLDLNTYKPRIIPGAGASRLEDEYAPLYEQWRADPSPQNNTAMLRAVRPVIDSAVRPLGGSPALQGRAKQLVLSGLRSYDPQRASLRTHLMTQLQGLRRIAGQQAQPLRIPERVVLDNMRLSRAHAELADSLYRDPTDDELADFTGMSVRRIGRLRQQARPVAESAATMVDEEGNENTPGVQHDTPQAILAEYVRSELNPQDQLLLDHATGHNGQAKLSGRELAAKLGVTPSAVSQRLARIQSRFRALEDLRLFGE